MAYFITHDVPGVDGSAVSREEPPETHRLRDCGRLPRLRISLTLEVSVSLLNSTADTARGRHHGRVQRSSLPCAVQPHAICASAFAPYQMIGFVKSKTDGLS